MNKSKLMAAGLCFSLIIGQIPATHTARANDERGRFGNWTVAAAAVTPIGTIEAPDFVVVNGRATAGHGAIWDGELLQVPPGGNAQVNLDGVGRVTLTGGSVTRLGVAISNDRSSATQSARVLTAAVISGEVNIALDKNAGASLQAGNENYVASAGASLRLEIKNERPVIEASRGTVLGIGNWKLSIPEMKTVAKEARDAKAAERDNLLRSINNLSRSIGSATTAKQPLELYTSRLTGMIGTVTSASAVMINGRTVNGKEPLWDGELIRVPQGSSARVAIDSVGQVVLSGGASAKLITAKSVLDGQPERRVLVVSGVTGALSLQLQTDTAAYIESRGSIFAAMPGTHLHISAQEGGPPVAEATHGTVKSLGTYVIHITPEIGEVITQASRALMKSLPRRYIIQPVSESYHSSVRANGTQVIKFRVTDEKSQTVAGLPIVFSLSTVDGKSLGTLESGNQSSSGYSAMTDANGLVSVSFAAGAASGAAVISASVPGTSATSSQPVSVNDKGFWQAKNAIPVLATVAAIGIAAIVVVNRREDKIPIKATGPTLVIP